MAIPSQLRSSQSCPSDTSAVQDLNETICLSTPAALNDAYNDNGLDLSQPVTDTPHDLSFGQSFENAVGVPRTDEFLPSTNGPYHAIAPARFSSDPRYELANLPSPNLETPLRATEHLTEADGDVFLDESRAGHARSLMNSNTHDLRMRHAGIRNGTELSTHSDARSQLISPQLTNTSSPADFTLYTPNMTVSEHSPDVPGSSAHQVDSSGVAGHHASAQQACLTANASEIGQRKQPLQAANAIRSPIVKISHHSRGDSPASSDRKVVISPGKRSGTSLSSNHLAPEDCYTSDDEEEHRAQCAPKSASSQMAWKIGEQQTAGLVSGRSGVDPTRRNHDQVASLKDLDKQQDRDARTVIVSKWLEQSQSGGQFNSNHVTRGIVDGSVAGGSRPNRRFRASSVGASVDSADDAGIPGPRALIDEDSDIEDTEESEPQSPESTAHANNRDQLFPDFLVEDLRLDSREPEPHQFPRSRQSQERRWEAAVPGKTSVPPTANAAMYKFARQASNCEAASHVATWGSRRRLSDTDVRPRAKRKNARQQSLQGFLDSGTEKFKQAREIISRKSSYTSLKLKNAGENLSNNLRGELVSQGRPGSPSDRKPGARIPGIGFPGKRRSSFSTRGAMVAIGGFSGTVGQSASAAAERETGALSAHETPKRRRSRSEATPSRSPSLAASVRSPETSSAQMNANTQSFPHPIVSAKHDEITAKPVKLDLRVKSDTIVPGWDGFRTHAKRLNPRIEPFLLHRIVNEQCSRHRRLVDWKVEHAREVETRGRSSLNDHYGHNGSEAAKHALSLDAQESAAAEEQSEMHGLHLTSEDIPCLVVDGESSAAPLPPGIPPPPVRRLPATFECPICFKKITLQKPSDWTKHVHEDVQPFTCTFPNCEVRSFKRKADWVRHEDEKHRHLEWWKCSILDCEHECYRRDNFVQHLVREHKMRDPKSKTANAGINKTSSEPSQAHIRDAEIQELLQLVDRCHVEDPKPARSESCKFCNNSCDEWKKLKDHLARHMIQIALPVLDLVRLHNTVPANVPSQLEPHFEPTGPLTGSSKEIKTNGYTTTEPVAGSIRNIGAESPVLHPSQSLPPCDQETLSDRRLNQGSPGLFLPFAPPQPGPSNGQQSSQLLEGRQMLDLPPHAGCGPDHVGAQQYIPQHAASGPAVANTYPPTHLPLHRPVDTPAHHVQNTPLESGVHQSLYRFFPQQGQTFLGPTAEPEAYNEYSPLAATASIHPSDNTSLDPLSVNEMDALMSNGNVVLDHATAPLSSAFIYTSPGEDGPTYITSPEDGRVMNPFSSN